MLKVCTQKDFVSATLKRIRYVKEKLSEQKARYSFRISKFEFQEHRKALSFALLISRYILQLGQAAQKKQRPCCPNPKMYLEIRKADERLYRYHSSFLERSK